MDFHSNCVTSFCKWNDLTVDGVTTIWKIYISILVSSILIFLIVLIALNYRSFFQPLYLSELWNVRIFAWVSKSHLFNGCYLCLVYYLLEKCAQELSISKKKKKKSKDKCEKCVFAMNKRSFYENFSNCSSTYQRWLVFI